MKILSLILSFWVSLLLVCSPVFGAIDLNGDADRTQMSDADDFTPSTNELSVFIWIQLADYTNRALVWKYSSSGQRSWSMGMNASDQLQVTLSDNAGSFNGVQRRESDSSMNDGELHHVGFVFNGGNTTLLLYVDGVSQATKDNTGAVPGSVANNTEPVYVGSETSGNYADGIFTELYIYKRALTQSEIDNLAKSRVKKIGLYDSIVSYTPYDDYAEGHGTLASTTFNDASGNGHDATGTDADNDSDTFGETFLSYPPD